VAYCTTLNVLNNIKTGGSQVYLEDKFRSSGINKVSHVTCNFIVTCIQIELGTVLRYNCIYDIICIQHGGRDSSVSIATCYGLDGPGLSPGGDEIFQTRPDRRCDPPSLLYNGYRVFPRG
jgi:hypothetical protein